MPILRRAATLLLLCTASGCTAGDAIAPLHYAPVALIGSADRGLLAAGVEHRPVPPSFFGMHVVGLGAHDAWPSVPFGLYRLHDATPRWHTLQPSNQAWYTDESRGSGLARMRYILQARDRNAAATPVLYTLAGGPNGGFPAWLKSARTRSDTLQAWRQHVSELALMFRGQITQWEVWNEFDCTCFYRGSISLMVQLTRVAREALRAVDPSNVIVAPAVTGKGLKYLADFLSAGGGQYVDVIAWHPALTSRPEDYLPTMFAVGEIMKMYGVAHLPLWATEGHPAAEAGVDPAAIVARSFILLWASGHTNFTWYAWDITEYNMPGDWITLTKHGRPDQAAPASAGYRATYDWLVGRRMVSLRRDGDTWVAQLESASGPQWIVWSAGRDPQPFRVPAQMRVLRRLDGTTYRVGAGTDYLPEPAPVQFSTS